MCWVMPPASPAATFALRMTSSSDVLPWSTWPMTVTTGARGTRGTAAVSPEVESLTDRVSSSSSSNDTTAASTPISLAIWTAVAASSVWLTVARMPRCMSSRWMSRPRTPSFSESSLTVTPSVKNTGPVGAGFLNSRSLPESCARVSLAARRIADFETGAGPGGLAVLGARLLDQRQRDVRVGVFLVGSDEVAQVDLVGDRDLRPRAALAGGRLLGVLGVLLALDGSAALGGSGRDAARGGSGTGRSAHRTGAGTAGRRPVDGRARGPRPHRTADASGRAHRPADAGGGTHRTVHAGGGPHRAGRRTAGSRAGGRRRGARRNDRARRQNDLARQRRRRRLGRLRLGLFGHDGRSRRLGGLGRRLGFRGGLGAARGCGESRGSRRLRLGRGLPATAAPARPWSPRGSLGSSDGSVSAGLSTILMRFNALFCGRAVRASASRTRSCLGACVLPWRMASTVDSSRAACADLTSTPID